MKLLTNLCLLILVAGSFHPASSLPNWYFNQILHPDTSSYHVSSANHHVAPSNHYVSSANHHVSSANHHVSSANHHVAPIQTPDRDVLQPVFNEDGSRRCTASSPCPLEAGDCHFDEDCAGSLKCGNNNCKLQFGLFSQENIRWDLHDDCCATNDNFCNQELLYPKSRRTCCSPSNPCPYGHGDCEKDADCAGYLICGDNNCGQFYNDAGPRDDCCVHPSNSFQPSLTNTFVAASNHDSALPEPRYNEDGSRKCSASSPCPLEAGDCQYDDDCFGTLKCGTNNCKLEFGPFSQEHERWDLHDDCCTNSDTDNFCNQELLYPKSRRTCCSPSNPCPHGHGECERDADCEGSLICGDKNCFQFYDDAGPRDDCCVFPKLAWEGGPHDWHMLQMEDPAQQGWKRSLSYNNSTANTGHD